MNIYEAATRASMSNADGITRKAWNSAIIWIFKPCDVLGDTRLYANKKPWNPDIEDILADDWRPVEWTRSTEPKEEVQISYPKKDWRSSMPAVLTALFSLGISIAALLLR